MSGIAVRAAQLGDIRADGASPDTHRLAGWRDCKRGCLSVYSGYREHEACISTIGAIPEPNTLA